MSVGDSYTVREDITVRAGDSFQRSYRVRMDGTPVELTSESQVTFAVFDEEGSVVFAKAFYADSVDSEGYVSVVLEPDETASENAAYYELEFHISDEVNITAAEGAFTVEEDLITPEVRQEAGS